MAYALHRGGWRILLPGALFCLGTLVGRADQERFSRSISAAERAAVGIPHLTSDQVAVLDALIRRDEQINAFPVKGEKVPAQFTARLSQEEMHSAGLDRLSNAERSRLDVQVQRYEALAQAKPTSTADISGIQPQPGPSGPIVHGMISFTYGVGSGGYHEMGGAMAVSIDDPGHGISLFASYAQSRGEGRGWGRPCGWGPWSDYLADPYGPCWP